MKVLFINLKRNIIPIIFLLFTICLILFSNSNIIAVKNGLSLWCNNVIPSIFPFFIATELLKYTDIPYFLGTKLNKLMKPLFNVPGIGAYAFIMGIISGYPVGAKIVSDLKSNNLCSKEEAERLITFTNNSGPLFILGTVGISLFYNFSIGLLLLLTHILASITVGFFFRFWKNTTERKNYLEQSSNYKANFNNLGDILGKSITNSINTVMLIGGFIILFSVIISILNNSYIFRYLKVFFTPGFNSLNINTNFIIPLLSGITELTSGLSLVCSVASKSLGINVILCAFLLGFGGISVMLQVLSIISKSDISIKPYLIGKLLHGIFAAVYTYLIIISTPYFNYLLF